ncbi:zinc finger, CCHC-type containing protein [Tanacetum coccineum]
MSTSSAHQQSLADAGSETRPPMLKRRSYIPWASRFKSYLNQKRETRKFLNHSIDVGLYELKMIQPDINQDTRLETEDDLTGDALKQYEADIKAMNLILISIPNDIYNSMDSWDTFQNDPEDYLTSAMMLLARAITHCYSTPTNNQLRSSSNTRNQAIVKADRVNIQSRNVGNYGRIARRSYNVQEESAKGSNVQKETENVQRNLRTSSTGNVTNVQCYNCSEKGHYARNYPNTRVRDSKYFMEQMLLAKKDEAGVILSNEQNDFLIVNVAQMEEIKELSANICMMARIQPANIDLDEGPSYDSAFIS